MPLNQGCSNFEFRDNQITVVEGPQHNTIYDNRTFHTVRQERKELTIWDQYKRVRTGDIKLIKDVITDDDLTISIARIRGEDHKSKFLYVGYSGSKALQAFKRDFNQFSAVKRLNVAQLFGYNDGQCGLPALIFYDALIPLNRVLSANKANFWVHLYFVLRLTVAEMERDGGPKLFSSNALWIEPRSGALRRGPYVPSNANRLRPLFDAHPTLHLDPLSIQTYSDINTVIDYLVRIVPLSMIFENQCETHTEWSNAFELWPYLVGLIWKSNQPHILTRWTGLVEVPRCLYSCHWCHSMIGEQRGDVIKKDVMKDGSVRFQYTDPTFFKYFRLQYKLFHGSEELDTESVWLAQAHSFFSQLGIHEDEWKEYSIIDYFSLDFDSVKVHTYREEDTDTAPNKPTPYLFVRPIPLLSDDETTWRSWVESTYFWSLDPSEQKEMSESMRMSLGLASFKTEISFPSRSWNLEAYKVMERFQHYKGFDPKTTDYARSLGYPLMRVVEDENRFQELGESNDDRSTSVDVAAPCPDTVRHDDVSSSTPNEIPDTETDEVTMGNKRVSKAAGSGSKRRKVHTDSDRGGEDECAMAESRIKRRRAAAAAYAKDPPLVPNRGKRDDLPQRELSSCNVRLSVRAQEAREVKSEGSASKKRGRGGRNGQVRANGAEGN